MKLHKLPPHRLALGAPCRRMSMGFIRIGRFSGQHWLDIFWVLPEDCSEIPRRGGALHKFVANCAPNLRKIAGTSIRASHEGCAKLSQICREFESHFRTNCHKYPLLVQIYYQNSCQSHFSGVYVVFEVFQDTWHSNQGKSRCLLDSHPVLSLTMASNYATPCLVLISFWMLTIPWTFLEPKKP